MLPSVTVTKTDGNTGVALPSARGILAIIAPSASGSANTPTSASKAALALATFGYGMLVDAAAYVISKAKKPVVLVRGTASTAAAYSAVTFSGTGTSVGTAGATAPLDDFIPLITIVAGGTRGVDGVTYTYSLDGGETTSGVTALGVATSILIPNSGVTLNLAAGTFVAGDTFTFTTTGPKMTTADVSTALEALRTSGLAWEMVLVLGHDATATTVSILDAWLSTREGEGKFRGFICNARGRNSGESEAAYLTAMTTAFSAASSIRGCVCVDGGDLASVIPGRGIVQKRPTALGLAARLMRIDYGVAASYVKDGPIEGFTLSDAQGNPKYHNEINNPGLDGQRLVAFTSFDRKTGAYIANPNTIAPAGSDFVWAQHIRTMNRACELVFDVLTSELSKGVKANPVLGPLGEVYIADEDAQRFDSLANIPLGELKGQVDGVRFVLSRTDDIGSNGAAVLRGDVQMSALRYVGGFLVNAAFTRSISVS